MEKHFLADQMQGKQEFRAEPWYNPYGDCITCQIADEAIVAERVDELLTVYVSAIDDRPIGFQIKGVAAIIKKFGLEALAVSSDTDDQGTQLISVTTLLLAAYDGGPDTIERRKAYASAMECPTSPRRIPASELQPA